jgi:hypothetical protein
MKPTLKLPGTERLKLNCDVLLSISAFKSNLRSYPVVKQFFDGFRSRVTLLTASLCYVTAPGMNLWAGA